MVAGGPRIFSAIPVRSNEDDAVIRADGEGDNGRGSTAVGRCTSRRTDLWGCGCRANFDGQTEAELNGLAAYLGWTVILSCDADQGEWRATLRGDFFPGRSIPWVGPGPTGGATVARVPTKALELS